MRRRSTPPPPAAQAGGRSAPPSSYQQAGSRSTPPPPIAQAGRRGAHPSSYQQAGSSGTSASLPGRAIRFPLRLVLLTAALALFLLWSNTALQATEFEASFPNLPAGFDGFRAVVLSDLHGAAFGKNNRRLFQTVAEQRPEIIFLLGDLEDSYRGPVPGYAEELADGLTSIAPVWYVTGNHEWGIGHVADFKKRLAAHGVHVLSNDFEIIDRNGSGLVLAGIDDPNGGGRTPEDLAEAIQSQYPDYFRILLAHRNNLFPRRYCKLGMDLVLSGHGHGGLVRLPFTDGLIDTNRSLFPSWTAGLYKKDGSTLFVTRGLGNSGRTFRLFNRPEVAVLTFRRTG